MSEQIVTSGGGRWRPPSNLREGLATVAALLIVLALVQVAAPLVKKIDFIAEEIRSYFVGVFFALFVPIERFLNRVLQSAQSGAGLVRPDLSPWFVTGVTTAALLFAWTQFIGFLSGAAIAAALRTAGAQGHMAQAVTLGATYMVIPLCAFGAVIAGMALNRTTRSGVLFALLLTTASYLCLSVFTAWIIQPDAFGATLRGQQGLPFVAALAFLAVVVFVFGGGGVLISRALRERSIGRLLHAARQLQPADRDAMTEDVMDRLSKSSA